MGSNETQTRPYHDFELTVITASPPHYRVLARSEAGQASGEMRLSLDEQSWQAALAALERGTTDETFFLQLGDRLFQALLPGDTQDLYRASMGYAQGEGAGLRLRLRLTDAPAIAALPWEFLYDRQRDIFVAVSTDTPLSRFIEPPQTFPPPPRPKTRLRLLTILSDPADLQETYGLPPLDGEAELATIDRALQRLRERKWLDMPPPLRHAVRADISEALREHRPHVLHWVGHGTFDGQQGKLIVEDEDHYALEMSDRAFRELLEGHPDTRLVMLNVCQGATRSSADAMVGLGPALVGRGVPAVVAMQYPVYDRAAISFTREFYRALAHWLPIDVAVSQARRAIYLDYGLDRRDWGAPVLFMRDRDGLLFTPPHPPADESTSAAGVQINIHDVQQTGGGTISISGISGGDTRPEPETD